MGAPGSVLARAVCPPASRDFSGPAPLAISPSIEHRVRYLARAMLAQEHFGKGHSADQKPCSYCQKPLAKVAFDEKQWKKTGNTGRKYRKCLQCESQPSAKRPRPCEPLSSAGPQSAAAADATAGGDGDDDASAAGQEDDDNLFGSEPDEERRPLQLPERAGGRPSRTMGRPVRFTQPLLSESPSKKQRNDHGPASSSTSSAAVTTTTLTIHDATDSAMTSIGADVA